MRSNNIDSTQHPGGPCLQLSGNNQLLQGDRAAFHCIDLCELKPAPGVTISIHPALMPTRSVTKNPEVADV